MNRLFGAILLVAGMTIGAGMLALPTTVGLSGLIPSIVLMTFIWLYMMLTAFYLLEVGLHVRGESNIITMVGKTLGRGGQAVAWVAYLLLLYSLLSAYMVGCGQVLSDLLSLVHIHVPQVMWPPIIFVTFSAFIFFGTRTVDLINRLFMVGLVLSYLLIIFLGAPHIHGEHLMHQNWSVLLSSTSVVLTSFGYHIIIPTLTTYLDHDKERLKLAIIIGSLIPFVVYIAWQLLALGVIPLSGEVSLSHAATSGDQVTNYLEQITKSRWVVLSGYFFAFFAIVTSLIGVAMSLADFLADGLKIKKNKRGKLLVMLIAFIPPLIFALFYPNGFILALNYAGLFVVVLCALLPTMMAYAQRYIKSPRVFKNIDFKVPGGKALMVCSGLLSLVLLALEVFK